MIADLVASLESPPPIFRPFRDAPVSDRQVECGSIRVGSDPAYRPIEAVREAIVIGQADGGDAGARPGDRTPRIRSMPWNCSCQPSRWDSHCRRALVNLPFLPRGRDGD